MKYNFLSVIEESFRINKAGRKIITFYCMCDCWVQKYIDKSNVLNWWTTSCGCMRWKNTTHWLSNHRLYNTWKSMMWRCYKPQIKCYKYYWWKWITVDKYWHNINNFINDMYPSYKEWLTLDRLDWSWNYCKENCRRITQAEQTRNKTNNIYYKWKLIIEWCDSIGIKRHLVYERIRNWRTKWRALWLE